MTERERERTNKTKKEEKGSTNVPRSLKQSFRKNERRSRNIAIITGTSKKRNKKKPNSKFEAEGKVRNYYCCYCCYY